MQRSVIVRARVSPAVMAEITGALEPRETAAEFLRAGIRAELERRGRVRVEAEAEAEATGIAALDELFAGLDR